MPATAHAPIRFNPLVEERAAKKLANVLAPVFLHHIRLADRRFKLGLGIGWPKKKTAALPASWRLRSQRLRGDENKLTPPAIPQLDSENALSTRALAGTAAEYAKARGGYVMTQIGQTRDRRLNSLLTKSISEGWSARDFAQELEDSGIFSASRADSIGDAEYFSARNGAAAAAMQFAGVTHVYITDGEDFDAECASLNGTIQTIAWYIDNPISHPNCHRDAMPWLFGENDYGAERGVPSTGEIPFAPDAFVPDYSQGWREPVNVELAPRRATVELVATLYSDDQPRDEHGRWTSDMTSTGTTWSRPGAPRIVSETPLDEYERRNLKATADEVIAPVAKALGFPPDRIVLMSQNHGPAFAVDGHPHTEAGHWDPEDHEITLWGMDNANNPGLVAHEIEHAKFQSAMKKYEADRLAMNTDPRGHDLGDGRFTKSVMRADGTLWPEFEKDYPVYAALGPIFANAGVMRELGNSDGISSYCKEYWAQYEKAPTGPRRSLAVNETLAEMAYIRALGEAQSRGDIAKSARFGHEGEKDFKTMGSEPGWSDPAPVWRNLYNSVNEVWDLPPHEKHQFVLDAKTKKWTREKAAPELLPGFAVIDDSLFSEDQPRDALGRWVEVGDEADASKPLFTEEETKPFEHYETRSVDDVEKLRADRNWFAYNETEMLMAKGLTEDEAGAAVSAASEYTSGGYYQMNGVLRRPYAPGGVSYGAEARDQAKAFEDYIAVAPHVPGDTELYRLCEGHGVLQHVKEGDVVAEKGFLSTSAMAHEQLHGALDEWLIQHDHYPDCEVTIIPRSDGKPRDAVAVGHLSENPGEREVVFQHGSRFRVKSVKRGYWEAPAKNEDGELSGETETRDRLRVTLEEL